MLTSNEIKYYASLLDKKIRNKENKFIVEGLKSVEDGLKSKYNCEIIIVSHLFAEKEVLFIKKLINNKINFHIVKESEIKKLSDTKTPQGIVGVFYQKSETILDYELPFVLYLDNISDPGNLGTIIRTCDWFGVKQLLLSNNCVDIYNPKVIRSTMGSIFHINCIKDFNLLEHASNFRENNFSLICANLYGKSIYEYEINNKILLILGSESHGISPEIKNISNDLITIQKKGKAESLNVASAAAVFISYFAG